MDITIPIMIDDVKMYKKFKMTRCTYFSIESDNPLSNWTLTLGENKIPFYLLGLSGIICTPGPEDYYFSTLQKIEKLFDTIEGHHSLYIDINDIWFPNFLFNDNNQRGSIYRIPKELFSVGMLYRDDLIAMQKFTSMSKEFNKSVKYSPKETEAFKEWSINQIDKAIELYHGKPELALEWDDSKGIKGFKNE